MDEDHLLLVVLLLVAAAITEKIRVLRVHGTEIMRSHDIKGKAEAVTLVEHLLRLRGQMVYRDLFAVFAILFSHSIECVDARVIDQPGMGWE